MRNEVLERRVVLRDVRLRNIIDHRLGSWPGIGVLGLFFLGSLNANRPVGSPTRLVVVAQFIPLRGSGSIARIGHCPPFGPVDAFDRVT